MTKELPSVDTLLDYAPSLTTRVYSADEKMIGEFYIERRTVVPLTQMPKHLILAILAAEDAKFFKHSGLDYTGIVRAMYKNIQAGRTVQGASTITQQVAKSFFLTPERTYSRKIREAFMASRIESTLTKDEILHLYLNQIYFGSGSYGVQSAAESYFGKDVSELTIAESAMLAALPKAPSRYSPYIHPKKAKKRQRFILTRMVEERYITEATLESAVTEEIKLKPKTVDSLWVAPYFTEHIRRYLEKNYGSDLLYKGGLNIYTSHNIEYQKAANAAVRAGLIAHDKRRGYRGPVDTLKTTEDIKAFKDEADKALKRRPFKLGRNYRALIRSISQKGKIFEVEIGSRIGILKATEMKWARQYNPTDDPNGQKKVKLTDILHPGDVIEVELKELPEEGDDSLSLSLYQEPLAEGALIAMDPSTGYVKAMVGGYSFSKSQFNRAIQAKRQPGSAFKPIIYSSALEKGYTTATTIVDSPLVFEETVTETSLDEEGKEEAVEELKKYWKPKNFEKKFHGPTTVREALTKSRNIITIKVLQDIGVSYAVSYARKLGVESPLSKDLTLALGSSSVSLIELMTVFSTIANL
ncbi:MAG: transglycosylase domain-containing protein, partial [Thermodesulfobacteriota bacterium]